MAQSLMKRGKRNVAVYIKHECVRPFGQQQLFELLDYLLDPEKSLDDFERLDWCRWVIAGGTTFDDFAKTVRTYDNATTCGLVWTADFVAYRCRTCGISACMSICADCFQAGNHTGHDFNMFRSQSGGACDCGDDSVMRENGFCPRHGPHITHRHQGAPEDLLVVAEAMMPRIFFRLIQHMRDHCTPDMLDTYRIAMQDVENYLDFLHALSDMGAAMRDVICRAVTNPNVYRGLSQGALYDRSGYHAASDVNYRAALTTLTCPSVPAEFTDVPSLSTPLHHTSLLEELVFWMVKFELPQKIVTLLLSFLPDEHYKVAFTRAVVQHYSRLSVSLVRSLERARLSSRVVHISVQLFSSAMLVDRMEREHRLLAVMVVCLRDMLDATLTQCTLNDADQNFHLVVDCSHEVLRQHCFWPIVSDLINVFSHKTIAHIFMADKQLIHFWFELLSCLQGMNLNRRELLQHVEFEPETYYTAFTAEFDISASPMSALVAHCRDETSSDYSQSVISAVIQALYDWFDAINTRPHSRLNPLQLTFHLPLHRHLAVFLSDAVHHQRLELSQLLPGNNFLLRLMLHPLQLQAAYQEIQCGIWVRNGLQMRGQAITYIQCHFCNAMVDADLYLLQVCATKLDPDYFVKTILDRFHVLDLLTFAPRPNPSMKLGYHDIEHEMPMIEGALTLLCMLLNLRTLLGISEAEQTRMEVVSLLCMADRTHSQLKEMTPEKCGVRGQMRDFEPTLKKVADYKEPNFEAGGAMQQGMYVPKGSIWDTDYDPLYVILRSIYRKDFQSSMDRYGEHVKQTGAPPAGSLWPPFRLPGVVHEAYIGLRRLLHCRTMHALIFTLLYKIVNEPGVSEAVTYFTIYLLEMAVSQPSITAGLRNISVAETRRDKHFSSWFETDSIFLNLRQVIEYVEVSVLPDVADLADLHDLSSSGDLFAVAPSALTATDAVLARQEAAPVAGQSSVVAAPSFSSLGSVTEPMDNFTVIHPNTPAASPPPTRSQGVGVAAITLPVRVGECMLSLLVRLSGQLAVDGRTFRPDAASVPVNSRVGDGAFFVNKLLEKICRLSHECDAACHQICHQKEPPVEPSGAGPSSDVTPLSEKELRRQKARQRQEKMIAEFASKQKQFLKSVVADNTDMETDEDSSTTSRCLMPEKLYDCVICNQSTASKTDRPIGLVAMLQPTSVLGHCRHADDPHELPVSEKMSQPNAKLRATEAGERLETMLETFEENSCLLSVNIGWEGGVHAQTCGHYVHLDCLSPYLLSLQTTNQAIGLETEKAEYWCPLCRSLANAAIPIMPCEGATLVRPTPSDTEKLVGHIGSCLAQKSNAPGTSVLTTAMGSVMEYLTNVTYPRFRAVAKSHLAENVLLFVCSILRTNLELELLHLRGHHQAATPSPSTSAATSLARNKSCVGSLLPVLAMHCKILANRRQADGWGQLTGWTPSAEGTGSTRMSVYHQEVPLLLKDVSSLLIQFVLMLPTPLDRSSYRCIVSALYNAVYVQAITVMSCTFSDDERSAWEGRTKDTSFNTLEGLLNNVIRSLSPSRLYWDDSASQPPLLAICQSVWSPLSVESSLRAFCLPFLRLATLLAHHLHGDDLPGVMSTDADDEFQLLCVYLGLAVAMPTPGSSSASGGRALPAHFSGASCLRWHLDEPQTLVRQWCQQFSHHVNKQPSTLRMLLMVNPTFTRPRLLLPPPTYDLLFRYYRRATCTVCELRPKDPTVCLACGSLVCFKERCCHLEGVYECVQHSVDCGGGIGVYLIINSSLLVIVRGTRAAIWGSLYLDEHGEEDRDLKRGRPLYLSRQRFYLLQDQWQTHSFDRSCKRWIFHHNKL